MKALKGERQLSDSTYKASTLRIITLGRNIFKYRSFRTLDVCKTLS